MTDKTAEFYTRKYFKETGGIYDACAWCTNPSGSIWSG